MTSQDAPATEYQKCGVFESIHNLFLCFFILRVLANLLDEKILEAGHTVIWIIDDIDDCYILNVLMAWHS